MAERTGRKPTPGRKHRSPRHKMAARIAPYSRGENHRRPGSTTARRSGGVCPVGFETRRGCCRWIRTPTIYVFLDVLRSIEERIVFITHDKLVSSPQAFSTMHCTQAQCWARYSAARRSSCISRKRQGTPESSSKF